MLRALPLDHDDWERALLSEVRPIVEEWRTRLGLSISIDKTERIAASAAAPKDSSFTPGDDLSSSSPATSDKAPTPDVTRTALEAVLRSTENMRVWSRPQRSSTPDDELRRRLHLAIDRMPAEELRRIALPIGYLFGN